MLIHKIITCALPLLSKFMIHAVMVAGKLCVPVEMVQHGVEGLMFLMTESSKHMVRNTYSSHLGSVNIDECAVYPWMLWFECSFFPPWRPCPIFSVAFSWFLPCIIMKYLNTRNISPAKTKTVNKCELFQGSQLSLSLSLCRYLKWISLIQCWFWALAKSLTRCSYRWLLNSFI